MMRMQWAVGLVLTLLSLAVSGARAEQVFQPAPPTMIGSGAGKRLHHMRQIPPTPFEKVLAEPASTWAPKAAEAPVIDGKLNDACWRNAGVARDFLKCDDSISMDIPADVPSEVLLCRDAKNLYMAFRLTGETARSMAQRPRTGKKYNWRGSRICTLLQLIGSDNWVGVYLNPDGGGAARSQREVWEYKGTFSAAASASDDGAMVELAIPFDNPELRAPRDGDWWRLQFGRVDNHEWTAWSNSRGAHENPSRYGYLFFGSKDAFEASEPPIPPKVEFYGESRRYRKDERTTQFIASLEGIAPEGRSIEFWLKSVQSGAVERLTVEKLKEPKVAFLFDLRGLTYGQYEMTARVPAANGSPACEGTWAFAVTDMEETPIAFPDKGVVIRVQDQVHDPDAAWPISTGLPLPRGKVYDPAELGLFENGVRIPANIIPHATWLPSRAMTDKELDTGGLRWIGLSFVAQYDEGKPRTYVLKRVPKDAAVGSPLTVNDTARNVIVQTGPAQITIDKSSFDGIHAAWLDMNGNKRFEPGEQLIKSGGGAYIVDATDTRFAAALRTRRGKTNPVVMVEESGPARVVVTGKGWYHDEAGNPLCQYQTRIIAYAGLPLVRVKHRTILTYDTRINKLADCGFKLPATEPAWVYFGADRGTVSAKPHADDVHWSSSLHQDRHDHFRMIHERFGTKDGQRAVTWEVGKEGVRSDGSVTYYTSRDYRGFSTVLRNVWQKYPKELEAGKEGVTLHFWPIHGGDTFSDDEELARDDVHKLFWAHEGKYLDMQIPMKYYDRLHEIVKTDWFALGESVDVGIGSNGIGTAISNEFVINLMGPDRKPGPSAALVQQDPHAVADPAFTCATNGLERIHHQDKKNFPAFERLLGKGYLAHTRFFSENNEWGMWNYADLHTYPKLVLGYPNLHRVWLASHYRNVQTAWLMYFRSGSLDWLTWARAYSDHFMNVDMCHYDDPERPIIGTDVTGKKKKGYVIHMAGAMMHCKGFAHWTSDLNACTHFIDPDSLLWRFYMLGDYAARDAYLLWASAVDRGAVPYTANREANNTLGGILAYYRYSWNPQMLLHVHRIGEALAGVPLKDHTAGCLWNAFWMDRYYGLTRDERIIERAKEFLAPGPISPRNGLAYSAFASLCYELTGDKSYIAAATDWAYRQSRAMYLNPEDPFDGISALRPIALGSFAFASAPRWQRAMVEAGLPLTLSRETGMMPYGGEIFSDSGKQRSNFEVLLLETEDRDVNLTLEYRSRHPVQLRLYDVGGNKLAEAKPRGEMHYGKDAALLAAPKDGKTGLLHLTGSAYELPLLMPISELPGEAAVIRKGGRTTIGGMVYYVSPSPAYAGNVYLRFGGPTEYSGEGPGIIQVADAKGATLLDTSIGGDLMRYTAEVTLNTDRNPLPWRVFVGGKMSLQIDGPEMLYTSPNREQLTAVLKALPQGE